MLYANQNIIRGRVVNACFIIICWSVIVFALYPGRFDGDAIGQYTDGLAFSFKDAHSAMFSAILAFLADIIPGPGPMMILQLSVWIAGIWLITDTLIVNGLVLVGHFLSVTAISPFLSFDFSDVQKDALLTGLLGIIVGSGVGVVFNRAHQTPIELFLVFCLTVLAIDTRQNGIFAIIPLLILFVQIKTVSIRSISTIVILISASIIIMLGIRSWINSSILNTQRSHVEYSLIIFDLAGISSHTGEDASGGMLSEFKAQVDKCYTPEKWDPFGWGECKTVMPQAAALLYNNNTRKLLISRWISAIVHHPIAYLRHRIRNTGCLLSIECNNSRDLVSGWAPRPWDTPNMRATALEHAIGNVAWTLWRGPVGAGWLWVLIAIGEFIFAITMLIRYKFEPTAYILLAVSSSAILYTISFAIFGVADEARYLHPIFFLVIIGLSLTMGVVLGHLKRGRCEWL